MIQWLGLCSFTAEGLDSISGQGTKIPQDTRYGQEGEKKLNNLNKLYLKATQEGPGSQLFFSKTNGWSKYMVQPAFETQDWASWMNHLGLILLPGPRALPGLGWIYGKLKASQAAWDHIFPTIYF